MTTFVQEEAAIINSYFLPGGIFEPTTNITTDDDDDLQTNNDGDDNHFLFQRGKKKQPNTTNINIMQSPSSPAGFDEPILHPHNDDGIPTIIYIHHTNFDDSISLSDALDDDDDNTHYDTNIIAPSMTMDDTDNFDMKTKESLTPTAKSEDIPNTSTTTTVPSSKVRLIFYVH